MTKNKLIERVWLRISELNKKKLEESAKDNGRTLGWEANNIFDKYFKNK